MKLPFSYTPLHKFPYNSRVSSNEFQSNVASKNYVLVAFRPGESLQASELNEIQENFYKHTTLYNIMFKNWFFVGTGGFEPGITADPIRGPSWIGAVPLHPDQIGIADDIITIKTGWYLVDDKSGIKFWVHNYSDKSISGVTNDDYVGFGITTGYIGSSGDAGLLDNSGGYEGVVSGADRYQLNIISGFSGPSGDWIASNTRPILQRGSNGVYKYLNNLKIG